MDKDYNSEMKQRSDLYLHLTHEEENEKEKKELEQQQFEETQARFEKFMGSNQEMFDFLGKNFEDHPSFLNLIHFIIMRVVEEYPNFSAIEYADYFSSLFSYKDISWYTRDLQQYLTRKVKFKLMGTTKGPRDILNIEEFEFLESHDLAEYLSCIIYYKLKSYEQFQNSAQLSFHQYTLRDAMCFYPVALNRFALNRFYSFKGHIENCFKKKSYRGNEYAHILIKDETRKVFKAVVRTENFFKLLNGLNEMRKHNCDIEIYGKVVKDKFKDEIILDVERFTLIINGNLFTYPSKTDSISS